MNKSSVVIISVVIDVSDIYNDIDVEGVQQIWKQTICRTYIAPFLCKLQRTVYWSSPAANYEADKLLHFFEQSCIDFSSNTNANPMQKAIPPT